MSYSSVLLVYSAEKVKASAGMTRLGILQRIQPILFANLSNPSKALIAVLQYFRILVQFMEKIVQKIDILTPRRKKIRLS